jgi:FtsP/CotA-like multicopper oxidase with cupredoxin domain
MIPANSGYLACSRAARRRQSVILFIFIVALVVIVATPAFAIAGPNPDRGPCTRPEAGSAAVSPPELRSHNGVLEVTLHFKYQVTFAGQGPPRYCYVTGDGMESPTLRVRPGDQLILHLKNDLPASEAAMASHGSPPAQDDCQAAMMSASMTNLHFHGTTIPATCHQDEVIRTAIPAGGDFEYRVTIPRDEPPGLYWYHPHPHGYSERQVQGGASGALIVEGIEDLVAAARNLPERVLILRDQTLTNVQYTSPDTPAWDISLNYVPIIFPQNVPPIIQTRPATRELWRVLNAGADTIFNLQLLVKGTARPVQIVAIDGVPLESRKPQQSETSVALPPGARAEFIVQTPAAGEPAQLVTTDWDTGIEGDRDPARPLANVVSSADAPALPSEPEVKAQRYKFPAWDDLPDLQPHIERRLFFSQLSPDLAEVDTSVFYFVTVAGEKPQAYRMGQPPNIVLHQGDVEDWIIENRAREDHVFHIHQIHFRVLEVDGKPVHDAALRDMYNLPHWDGSGPYPSVKLRMDFRDPNAVGTFLYHCHILKHEDMGMMGVIQVLPPGVATVTTLSAPAKIDVGTNINVTATVRGRNAVPSGMVQLAVDGIRTGRPIALVDGRASFTTSFGDSGEHAITADYLGDTVHDESLSHPLKIRANGP